MTSTVFKHRLTHHLLNRRSLLTANQATSQKGFTLVELLIVVVILGVLGAVGIPAYLNQVSLARENSRNQAVMAAAKACTALRVTADATNFEAMEGVVETVCAATGAQEYNSNISTGVGTQATAQVSPGGAVTLLTPADGG